MNNRPIGILDSGVGGLSIFASIKKLLPGEDIIYLADQKNFPYGTKDKKTLKKIVFKKVEFLVKFPVKLMVIACNTATVYTLEGLRKRYPLPIVGIVPIIKKAAEVTKNGRIAVISTSNTNRSRYLGDLIEKFAPHLVVYRKTLDGVIRLVEELVLSEDKMLPIIQKNLADLKKKNIDVLALGCTHFNFIKPYLKKFFGRRVQVLDSAGAIARQVKRVLENNQSLAKKKKGDYLFYTTASPKKFQQQIRFLFKIKTDVLSL